MEMDREAMARTRRDLRMRETATILAALRYWQSMLDEYDGTISMPEYDVATDMGKFDALTIEEIDDLCERLNS